MKTTLARRPLLFWSATVVVSAWLGLKSVPAAVGTVRASREQLQERLFQLERARRELAAESTLSDTVTALRRRIVDLAPRILSGNTAAEAANDLAGRVNLAVSRANGRLLRADPETDSTTAGLLRRVGMTVAFEGDVRGVADVLRAFAQDPVVLRVSQLRILATDPGGGEQGPEMLRVELVVRGWRAGKS